MVDYEIIGKRMRAARLKKNMTQHEFADEIGISIGYVSQIENGKKCFNISRLQEASKVLDESVSYFVEGADKNTKKALVDEIKIILCKLTPEKTELAKRMVKVIVEK